MADAEITHFPNGGVMLVGDGQRAFRAFALVGALRLAKHGIMTTRGMTRKRLLTMASTYSNRPYVNSVKGLDSAIADVQKWAEEMRDACVHEVVQS